MKSISIHSVVFLAILLIATGSPVVSQVAGEGSSSEPSIENNKLEEGESIRRRLEWFYSTRMAGAPTDEERATLRAEGVETTRKLIQAQRSRRADGMEDTTNFWVSKGPSPSHFGGWSFGDIAGRISSLALDPAGGIIYLGTASGGLWKSSNDGLTWTALFDAAGTQTIGTVAVDPNDSNVIWAGTGENNQGCEGYFGIGLLRSVDGGLNWESCNGSVGSTLDDLSSFANIVIDPRNSSHLVTGGRIRGCESGSSTNGGIYSSDDAGLTWTQRLGNKNVYEIAQDPVVLDTLWAATSAGVYKSVDNGLTWAVQTNSGLPAGSTGRTELAISPSSTNTVYVLFGTPNALWRTTDGGSSWTQQASGADACDGQCWYNMVLRVHNTDPNIVIRGTIRMWKSIDGGVTWSDLSNGWGSGQKVHQDMHVTVMDPNNDNAFYVAGDGGVWKTENLGSSFTNKNGNLNITQFYAIDVTADDPETICGGAHDNSSLARTTSDTWDLQTVTGDGFVCHFNPLDPNYAYITSYPSGGLPSIYRSTSGVLGSFFKVTGSGRGITAGDRVNWVTPYVLDPVVPSTLYVGTHRVYRSDNHGTSWKHVGPGDLTGGSGSLLSLEINRNYPDIVYSGSASGRLWRSANGGNDWTDLTAGLPSRSINDIAGDPTDPERAFAVVGGFNTTHLWEWNLGSGWVARGADLPNVPANTVLMLSGAEIMVGTDTGVFRSSDGGVTFQPYMDGLPQGTVVTDLKYNMNQNVVTAGTYGRGAWQVPIDSIGPILLYDSIELPMIEVDGDGDGDIEPGETWSARPVLRNGGSESALDVQASLASPTPGIRILEPVALSYGAIAPGGTASVLGAFEFTVDPSFSCGVPVVFDLVAITSSNGSGGHADKSNAFGAEVIGGFEPNVITTLLDENFDGADLSDWSHRTFTATVCPGSQYLDEWNLASLDAAHGTSFYCGTGRTHSALDNSWLHYRGRESTAGAGLVIPSTAMTTTMTVVHWYDTELGIDGGQVVIDAVNDGQDVYVPLAPAGGYPGSALAGGGCNALQGNDAFQGASPGWVTSVFDLTPYAGKTVYIAFVFGSDDDKRHNGEGWYVDQVKIEMEEMGAAICQVIRWPGSITVPVTFDLMAGGEIQAVWGDSCNIAEVPGQGYSIQAGDLTTLQSTGQYSHAPVLGQCSVSAPMTFTPGAGDEYYLVVPTFGGREGDAGADSDGADRPQPGMTCGLRRVESCP